MIKFFENNADMEYTLNLINNEEINIQVARIFQENLKKEVLDYSNSFIDNNFLNSQNPNLNIAADFFWNISKALRNLSTSLEKCDELDSNIKSLKEDISSLNEFNPSQVKNRINEYNKKFISINDCLTIKTNEVQLLLASCQKNSIFTNLLKEQELKKEDEEKETIETIQKNEELLNNLEDLSNISSTPNNEVKENTYVSTKKEENKLNAENSAILDEFISAPMIEFNIEESDLEDSKSAKKVESGPLPKILENTLVVSEKNDKVILPYTLEELDEKLKSEANKYKNIDEIIDKEYTRPLQYYKNSALARFKEAFKLVKERSHGSFKHAIDLAFELAFCYNLHPAVISACKNVDELDVYLSCLEYDELEDFKFFKIIFDVLPKLSKKDKSLI